MFDDERADRAIKFMELIPHTQGIWAGKCEPFLDWEREIVREVFGTVRPDGTRQYRIVYIEVPKKNGKTTFASRIALYLAYADGERGGEVYFAASDRDQAGICYRAAKGGVEQTFLIEKTIVVDSVKRIVIPSTGSFLQVLSADVKKHHGLNVHGAVIDELHAHPNRDLYDVLTKGSGAARSQPLYVIITTAGYDRNSICYELHNKAEQIEKGIISDPTFYGKIYGLKEEDNWELEENWIKANPSINHIFSLERLREDYQSAKGNPADEVLFRRLRLNQWTSSHTKWMPIDKWDLNGNELSDPEGLPIYAGLDLSSTIDLTSLAYVYQDSAGQFNFKVRFWIPEDTMREKERKDKVPYSLWVRQGYVQPTPGNVIDYQFILEQLKKDKEFLNIREIAFDRWGATKLVQELQNEGFTVVPFGQGVKSMSPPTKELMTLVLQEKINHGNNPVLRWNVDNLVIETDAAGNIKPNKAKSIQKIDGAVAVIMGLDRAIRHESQERDSVYAERGVRVI